MSALAPITTVPSLADLYREELDYVWQSIHRLGISSSDAEDLAHDVFVTVGRRLGDFDTGRPVRPWLFGILLRTVSEFRRRPRHAREVFAEAPVANQADPRARPDELAASNQERSRLLEAVALLPPEQRAVFVMHDMNGHAMREVAQTLEIPQNTAFSRLRLARAAITAKLRSTLHTQEAIRGA